MLEKSRDVLCSLPALMNVADAACIVQMGGSTTVPAKGTHENYNRSFLSRASQFSRVQPISVCHNLNESAIASIQKGFPFRRETPSSKGSLMHTCGISGSDTETDYSTNNDIAPNEYS